MTYVILLVQATSTDSKVDPEGTVESMEVQQSGSEQDSAPTKTADKRNKNDSKDEKESDTTAGPPTTR